MDNNYIEDKLFLNLEKKEFIVLEFLHSELYNTTKLNNILRKEESDPLKIISNVLYERYINCDETKTEVAAAIINSIEKEIKIINLPQP